MPNVVDTRPCCKTFPDSYRAHGWNCQICRLALCQTCCDCHGGPGFGGRRSNTSSSVVWLAPAVPAPAPSLMPVTQPAIPAAQVGGGGGAAAAAARDPSAPSFRHVPVPRPAAPAAQVGAAAAAAARAPLAASGRARSRSCSARAEGRRMSRGEMTERLLRQWRGKALSCRPLPPEGGADSNLVCYGTWADGLSGEAREKTKELLAAPRWTAERTHKSVHTTLYLRWAEGVLREEAAGRMGALVIGRQMGALDIGRHIQGFMP